MSRQLVSIRRTVSAAARTAYEAAWARARGEVTAVGAHAWLFRSTVEATRCLEFIEFSAGRDPRGNASVAAAFADLDRLAPPTATEEWVGG